MALELSVALGVVYRKLGDHYITTGEIPQGKAGFSCPKAVPFFCLGSPVDSWAILWAIGRFCIGRTRHSAQHGRAFRSVCTSLQNSRKRPCFTAQLSIGLLKRDRRINDTGRTTKAHRHFQQGAAPPQHRLSSNQWPESPRTAVRRAPWASKWPVSPRVVRPSGISLFQSVQIGSAAGYGNLGQPVSAFCSRGTYGLSSGMTALIASSCGYYIRAWRCA